jgi:hypothetical protein
MRTRSSWRALALVPFFSLAACGSDSGTPAADASVTDSGGVSAQVTAICAISRAASCMTSATCERDVMSLYDSVPARCASERSAFFSCAAASRGTTCAMFAAGQFAGCAAQGAALEACGSSDAATPPSDATASDAGADPPTPNAWQGPAVAVGLSLEGAGRDTPQAGEGMASLGIGPIGGPANGYILSLASPGFPRLGAVLDCRAGFTYSEATRSYTFSSSAMLTGPCTAMLDGMTTTFTVTGGTVSVAPAGNTVVRLNVTAAGALAMGTGVLQVTYTP